ncbi:MAG: methyltransferase domain-containing protein [Pseudomonadota bacterium]
MTLRQKLSNYFRAKRSGVLRGVIEKLSHDGPIKILDLGGRAAYWEQIGLDFIHQHNVSVTLLNLHATELSGHNSGPFQTVVGDACRLEFADGTFDLVHSNSVIEHVETWGNMKAFAAETRRVGKHYFVQTPYFWFPIDPHYYGMPLFHWLPRPIKARLLRAFPLATSGRCEGVDKAFEVVDAARLLCGQQFQFLFPDAKHSYERIIGLPKSMIAVR